ncbi:MAG TPA: aminotransferase class III-fold pyridoxal phosphate-dependent enzyme [Microthrixaceae bacterium]|nr:aspartate aminotransferase family protein [Microthrixaceae bacterium]MCO5306572.1 aminotransferase class III-fold pyridoxal phosphate-dependent enzyme [Microthrixaceae bacterium]HMV73850.1 aminotransferase class III-fold pyridoxal phosphate-dependent enzyme [Microthrixaceae bacterium]HMY87801.1 aminotransferase class III-fold pyridoxal phosphate-dependent enzyme [Microthrixaceae bacterium]HNE75870.1 aminotransferase class III-fold pyridoxal phosphate-dependent enzyme [Microthrixaceae bacteri
MADPTAPYPDRSAVEEAFAAHVNRGKVDAYRALGLELVMGERDGIRFRDAYDGTWYVNCHCNGGVFNLGHRHPAVVAAVRDALEALDVGNHHLVSGWRARLAERLSATTGGALPGVVFGVGGGEAIDLAIKVARAHTGRAGVVSVTGGYHGHTGLALAAGDPAYRDPFGPNPPGFTQVVFDDLDAMAAAVDERTAVVLVEPIPATLGMPIPSPGYLAGLRTLCDERGALLAFDEVQTGLGRTGTVWYHVQEGVTPDLLVTGKGLSGGVYPITATLMTAELHRFFDDHPFVHVSTFGGAELGCVAGLATLDVVEAPGFLDRVVELGERFESELADMPFQLRRRGMFMGLAFDDPAGGMTATQALVSAGVFAIFANNDPSVLQFLPPLTIADDEVDDLIATLRRVLGS